MSAVIDIEEIPSGRDTYREDFQRTAPALPKVPMPVRLKCCSSRHRHAAPSAPWPWMDFDVDSSEALPPPSDKATQDLEWSHYPQGLFENWTHDQVERCGILKVTHHETCRVHKVDIFKDGSFDRNEENRTVKIHSPGAYWDRLRVPPPSNIRVRALFVENMTVPVLQILGTRYNIEPFFFASSANWIPSRYREDPRRNEDHVTVVLPFVRTTRSQRHIAQAVSVPTANSTFDQSETQAEESFPSMDERQVIDTQIPLLLPDERIILQDLLAIHMHRTTATSTIISYHPCSELQRIYAWHLHSCAQKTGDSVYWSKIFDRSKDPTFFFLAILWYALYAWDEAFEVLYGYINTLESKVLRENDIKLTRKMHNVQAHLLYYQQLLRDFQVSVEFIKNTPNPAMIDVERDAGERRASADLLCKEADNLMHEIDRLTRQRLMMSERLQNVIFLAFSTVNFVDHKAMQRLATETKNNSAAMKQIAYLTTVFLPATYLANVFSMNVSEINPGTHETLRRYVEVTVGLTLLTSWVAIAFRKGSDFHPKGAGFVGRALWPMFYGFEMITLLVRWLSSKGPQPSH